MGDVVKELTIEAPVGDVWGALTDPDIIGEWMGDGGVEVDLRVGGAYSFFGGETTGIFRQIKVQKLLEYTWRQSSWESSWPDSLVRWELHPDGVQTKVRLTHSQFPNEDECDSHDAGWDLYWLAPMVDYLETGA